MEFGDRLEARFAFDHLRRRTLNPWETIEEQSRQLKGNAVLGKIGGILSVVPLEIVCSAHEPSPASQRGSLLLPGAERVNSAPCPPAPLS